jgi:hypothetical protein
MTQQDPQSPRVAPGTVSRGGEEKTTFRTDRVLLGDLDAQPSAEGWTPVLLDTPGFGGPLLPAQDDSLPPLPLPGPVYPNSR